jgi:hypothetical protein
MDRSMRTSGFVLISLVACGGSSGSEPPEGGPPILDRPPRLGHECSITDEPAIVADSQQQAGIALARTEAGYLAARGTYDPETFEPQIALSELRFDPVELAPPHVEMSGAGYYARPALVVRDGTVGLSWIDDAANLGGQELRFAVLDGVGELVAGPVSVHGADDEVMIRTHALAATADGFALLWGDDSELRFRAFDGSGAPAGARVTVAGGQISSAYLVRRSDGFAAVWIEESGVHLALLDDRGAPRTERDVLAEPGRDETFLADPFVVAVGDELVVTWTEGHRSPDYEDPDGGHAVVRLARVSGDGELIGAVERLQAAEDGIVSAVSSLLPMDGALAIAWSRETYIAICGGCMSDATIRLILLDPVDLVPVSEAVELVGPSGLRSTPMVAAEDGDVAFFMTVDYHALADLAAAKIRCTRAP